MGTENPKLSIFIFPFMAHGHMIPALDLAKLFASKGATSTIITTPLNLPCFQKSVERSKAMGLDIDVITISFPASECGLPQGCENLDVIIQNYKPGSEVLSLKLINSTPLLKDQLEELLERFRPDCLISDMFFPWSTASAAKFNVARLVFHGTSFFSLAAVECVRLYEPHKILSSDSETFLIPKLPGQIRLRRNQIEEPAEEAVRERMRNFEKQMKESEVEGFGVVVNSFYELERVYADYYREDLGRRAWHVGPLSLCNRGIEEKSGRGKESSMDESKCLNWLDSKKPRSVVYLSFGSLTNFTNAQLKEIAKGLEASGKDFVWVVRRNTAENAEKKDDWLPDGFEDRMKHKGLIIRGWAPQVLILEHEAVGAFVTHCGWNSTLESITAGVPMVTWPVAFEQFYNEIYVTQILGIGVSVGVKQHVRVTGEFIGSDMVERAVREVMDGEEAPAKRDRAQRWSEQAKAAVVEGGSSDLDLTALMEELMRRRSMAMKT